MVWPHCTSSSTRCCSSDGAASSSTSGSSARPLEAAEVKDAPCWCDPQLLMLLPESAGCAIPVALRLPVSRSCKALYQIESWPAHSLL